MNQIRRVPHITDTTAAGFQDASLLEAAKKRSDREIKNMVDRELENTSVTVVFKGVAILRWTKINAN